jgi:hypothetical protein
MDFTHPEQGSKRLPMNGKLLIAGTHPDDYSPILNSAFSFGEYDKPQRDQQRSVQAEHCGRARRAPTADKAMLC